jgi:hypothetical protein
MSNLLVKDGAAATKYLKATGAGTNVDPHIQEHLETNSLEMLGTNQDIAVAAQAIQVATEAPLYVDDLGDHYQRVKVAFGEADTVTNASATNPLPVTGPLTDAQIRATPLPVSGTVTTTGLTDTQLRATPVPVSGTVTTGALTDAQLRATAVPVSGTVTAAPATRTLLTVTGTRTTSGDGTALIAAPAAGNHVVIVNLEVNPSEATVTIILKSGSTAKRTWTLAQNSLYANDYPRGHELRMGSAAAVYLNLSGDSDTNYAIDYFLEAD